MTTTQELITTVITQGPIIKTTVIIKVIIIRVKVHQNLTNYQKSINYYYFKLRQVILIIIIDYFKVERSYQKRYCCYCYLIIQIRPYCHRN